MSMSVVPVTLEGEHVRLEPMESNHLDALAAAGGFEELWRLTTTRAVSRDEMSEYMKAALTDQSAGSALPFVTVDKASRRIVGSTRFGNIDGSNRRAEIGKQMF